jgi:hypothetical protein
MRVQDAIGKWQLANGKTKSQEPKPKTHRGSAQAASDEKFETECLNSFPETVSKIVGIPHVVRDVEKTRSSRSNPAGPETVWKIVGIPHCVRDVRKTDPSLRSGC